MPRAKRLDFDEAVDYLMDRIGGRVAVSWPDEVAGDAGWRNTFVGELDLDPDKDSPYAFRIESASIRDEIDVDPAEFQNAALESGELVVDLGWRVYYFRDAHFEDDPRLIEAPIERQVVLPNGKSVPMQLHLPPEAALKSISVGLERDPRPGEWQLLYELRNLAREHMRFEIQFIARDGETPVLLEEDFLRLDGGQRRVGRIFFRAAQNVTSCELLVAGD